MTSAIYGLGGGDIGGENAAECTGGQKPPVARREPEYQIGDRRPGEGNEEDRSSPDAVGKRAQKGEKMNCMSEKTPPRRGSSSPRRLVVLAVEAHQRDHHAETDQVDGTTTVVKTMNKGDRLLLLIEEGVLPLPYPFRGRAGKGLDDGTGKILVRDRFHLRDQARAGEIEVGYVALDQIHGRRRMPRALRWRPTRAAVLRSAALRRVATTRLPPIQVDTEVARHRELSGASQELTIQEPKPLLTLADTGEVALKERRATEAVGRLHESLARVFRESAVLQSSSSIPRL